MNDLPRLMLVTQRERMRPDFFGALEAALRGGARLIQLREKNLSGAEFEALARRAHSLCAQHGATLLLNNAPGLAQVLGAGLHQPETALAAEGEFSLRGASVHSLEATRRAAGQGAAYLVFGSVFETQSHPGAAPTGLQALREVCAIVEVPVFAIGGITAVNAQQCLAAGAHGVAIIGAVWDAPDIEAAVRELVEITTL